MPGPGSYNLPTTLQKTSLVKYSQKEVDLTKEEQNASLDCFGIQDIDRLSNPGPGKYNPQDLNKVLCGVKYSNKRSFVLKNEDCNEEIEN